MKFCRTLSKVQLLLIPAIMWLFTNTLINTHYHYLADGQVISHAHPYDKTADQGTPFKSHKHTKGELIILSLLDKADVVIAVFIGLYFLLQAISAKKTLIPTEAPVQRYYQVHHYHGPPA